VRARKSAFCSGEQAVEKNKGDRNHRFYALFISEEKRSTERRKRGLDVEKGGGARQKGKMGKRELLYLIIGSPS